MTRQNDRDRLDAQLQSQRLESLGELAGGVAHDFNNLLGVISNYAEFISEEAAKDAGQVNLRSLREDVGQIQRAADRAAELTHQLLAFARRDVARPRPLNLNEAITNVKQLLIRTLGAHVVLKADLAPGLCLVLMDPGQMEQVLVNLAVNARDAMPDGGTLTIETTNVDTETGPQVRMTITDTGTGMDRATAARVFEPFFTTKPKGCGTGLGLATVYGIITRAGGSIDIRSEPGHGTTFAILLPATCRDTVAEPGTRPAPGGGGETVLVVEDEPAMREVTRRILCRNGYQVITAVNGREAVEVAAAHEGDIDVLLSDVVMPEMQGKEAAERIRALRPGVKVLFMSGYTHGLLGAHGAVPPGINLIEKPFTEKSLLDKLRQVIAG